MTKRNPVVATAKKIRDADDLSEPVQMSTGVMVRLHPVPLSIMTESQAAVKDPEPPMWFNEAKGRDEPNVNHPSYLSALERVDSERQVATIDAMILFGVDLVDGVPEDDRWLKILQLRDKAGLSDKNLESFDLSDPIDREFLYKKYFAIAVPDYAMLMKVSGVSEETIAQAMDNFQDNKKR